MMDVYQECPSFESDRFLLRLVSLDDAKDLVDVYGDKNALPFFNSDNCHGHNFYYPDENSMRQAIGFWLNSYTERWFVRWSIVDKRICKAIGTVELFHRVADDEFNHTGVLRLDVGNDYEKQDSIADILELIVPSAFDLSECNEIITKVPVYAVERTEAVRKAGFEKSDKLLIGTADRYAYKDYWTLRR